MHASITLFAVAAFTGAALGKSGKCHGQRLYCGRSLRNLDWSDDDIMAGVHKGAQWYPVDLGPETLLDTLFECDGRAGDDALWWRSACADNGCHDAGAGHSDYCN
ncbi:hypothetical protein C8A03DRAFT_47197 [Achaetomium macrosporum]|uniref:Uncharacterized protein n=1 Tax=Achaetomium macrosporum TaxID=79813 RepID=A0AAN7H4H2_9PEZI|nr:hypothetical protein C8A03DRAFT_47197 [Achaetomium macrosporum]